MIRNKSRLQKRRFDWKELEKYGQEKDRRYDAERPTSPAPLLYLAGGGLNERRMIYHRLQRPYGVIMVDGQEIVVQPHHPYPLMTATEVDGRRFVVRQMDQHLLFRDLDAASTEDALYLPDTSLANFAKTYRRRAPGRCVLYVPECMVSNRCVYCFFDTDGTGFVLHPNLRKDTNLAQWAIEHERVDFHWNNLIPRVSDIHAFPTKRFREVCRKLFKDIINPQLGHPYEHPEYYRRVPRTWLQGSEEELRRLTRAICYSQPDLFEPPAPVTIVYRATLNQERGGFQFLYRMIDGERKKFTADRMVLLCELAFRLNPFTGMDWRRAQRLEIKIAPPTAHEKAEACSELVIDRI